MPHLVVENEQLKGMAKNLGDSPFDFSKFVEAMSKRSSEINKIRIRGAFEIEADVLKLSSDLKEKGLNVGLLSD